VAGPVAWASLSCDTCRKSRSLAHMAHMPSDVLVRCVRSTPRPRDTGRASRRTTFTRLYLDTSLITCTLQRRSRRIRVRACCWRRFRTDGGKWAAVPRCWTVQERDFEHCPLTTRREPEQRPRRATASFGTTGGSPLTIYQSDPLDFHRSACCPITVPGGFLATVLTTLLTTALATIEDPLTIPSEASPCMAIERENPLTGVT
jgi:hypothetical protein